MHASSGQSPAPSPDDAPDAIGVEDARKTLPTLINAAQNGNATTIRFDTHCAKIVGIAPGTDLSGLPRFGVRDTREKLSALVSAAAGQASVITRNSKPVALLVSAHAPARPASSRVLATVGDSVTALLGQSRQQATIGIPGIDQAAAVLRPGRLTLVVGAPGTGTSLLALSAATTAALDAGTRVLYAASGPTRTDVTCRIIAARADVDYQRLRANTLNPTEQQAVTAFAPKLQAAPLLIDDGTGLDTAAIAEVLHDDGNQIRLVVVDRLQSEPHPHRPLSGDNVPPAVRELAHLAQQHQIPILAALDSPDHTGAVALGADLLLALTNTETGIELRITEADLGVQTDVPLLLDGSRARLLDRPAAEPPAPPTDAHPTPGSGPESPAAPAVIDTKTQTASVPAAPVAAERPAETPSESPLEGVVVSSGATKMSTGRGKDAIVSHLLKMIETKKTTALEITQGDIQAAIVLLQKTAIPDVMALFNYTREEARYEHTAHPPLLDLFRRQGNSKADAIWEGRPNWENEDLLYGDGPQQLVSRLDMNAAYLSAFKSHLPIGQLKHHTGADWDPKKMAGIVRVSVAPWEHRHLPDPMGSREQTGDAWITTATLSLLRRLAGMGLCQPPRIHEAWVAHSSEHILEYLRVALATARQYGIDEGDDVVVEYVKDMYAKFVSTAGTSTNNHLLNNPSWQHIMRSQAFFNLYLKALKAHKSGLQIAAMKGTDELHVIGEWRQVFEEGRGLSQVKEKAAERYYIPMERPKRRGRK
ncbi:DnaB-like helicase C-terminal domain-containing protein [Kitasatospora sp. GP82]|uniref:DnaB-like helicase C-terminal domain-containing protein n=1 Tax=Kitasatospora sp. GP82 TaxID=3035089 RepID=UPI0024764FAF|nr:DnaB-like helicase C-terminal domain-containing protein [Kitasatospora sp. GP82]MDH6129922.1 antitoxin (DNA-binding transcriptional repressor) of toxin-antitoxin stability system [Kitasatospora sp. GP82]